MPIITLRCPSMMASIAAAPNRLARIRSCACLLYTSRLPDREELASFRELINDNMPLEQKTKMNIIELEGNNIMNILARSVLEMYRFDPNADDKMCIRDSN